MSTPTTSPTTTLSTSQTTSSFIVDTLKCIKIGTDFYAFGVIESSDTVLLPRLWMFCIKGNWVYIFNPIQNIGRTIQVKVD